MPIDRFDSAKLRKLGRDRAEFITLKTWVKCLLVKQGGGGVPVKIKSKVNDRTYLVDIYENGAYADDGLTELTPSRLDINCIQLQIDVAEVIPAGTWAIATKSMDGKYYMQTPVWLDG